jgi:hypothetical protein
VGYEVFLGADESQTSRIPTKGDVERLFDGLIRQDEPQFHRLDVGTSDIDSCGVYYSDGTGPFSMMVERPVESGWLWDRVFRLLQEFDVFLFMPDEELRAFVARDEVPLPEDVPFEKIVARSPADLWPSE